MFTLPQKITSYRFLNTIGNSRSNISAHYDISNAMFAGKKNYPFQMYAIHANIRILGFLSEDMTYSCGIFEELDGDLKQGQNLAEWSGGKGLRRLSKASIDSIRPSSDLTNGTSGNSDHLNCVTGSSNGTLPQKDELHEAQLRKLHHIIKKAKILPGHRVLEIGSGWGSMAILIAQTVPDTTVDTITLSVQQQTLAQERIKAAGLDDRITVHLMDYRDMPPEWEGVFDRVVSVEMIEAVGAEFLETYWKVVDWAMKLKGGVGVVQVISIPEARMSLLRHGLRSGANMAFRFR